MLKLRKKCESKQGLIKKERKTIDWVTTAVVDPSIEVADAKTGEEYSERKQVELEVDVEMREREHKLAS